MNSLDSTDVFELAKDNVCNELKSFAGYTGPDNPHEMSDEQIIIQLGQVFDYINKMINGSD